MNLEALCLGEFVPQTFAARAHSAFRSALNLRYEDTLLTLTAADQDDLPQGIRLATPAGFSFENFKVGDLALCEGDTLRLPALTVNLRRASRWISNLSALQADFSSDSFSQAQAVVWQTLNQRQRALGADVVADELLHPRENTSLVCKRAGEALRELLACAQTGDTSNLTSPLKKLIGLGAGLTPSGDDLLVGFFVGMYIVDRSSFLPALADETNRLSFATNAVSRAYLFHASRGRVSRRLATLAEALCNPARPADLLAAFQSAAQTGHSSGMDAISGMMAVITLSFRY
ncbi:MAG: DUF2877 domain-containing protein [Anaerolineales bacterium]|nr:DUF2877 domain-containing protein [Anaerolineales bacterium]